MPALSDTMNRRQVGYLSWICERYHLYLYLNMGIIEIFYNHPKNHVTISSIGTNPVRSIRKRTVPIATFPKQEDIVTALALFGAVSSDRFHNSWGLHKVIWGRITLSDFLKIRTANVKKSLV